MSIPESRLQWIISAYSLAFGCFLLLWGRIADIYGKRLIFIWGSVWVTAVVAATPFLPNEIAFDLFRGLHGLVRLSISGEVNYWLINMSRALLRMFPLPLVF